MPIFCNYRSFCILGPLAHVQLTCDTKRHANKLKMTRFHQQFMFWSLVLTRAPFHKISILAQTIGDLFGMCDLPISFPINRGLFFLNLQAWTSRKNPASHEPEITLKPIFGLFNSSFFNLKSFPKKLHRHHLKLTTSSLCLETFCIMLPIFSIVDLWSFNLKGR